MSARVEAPAHASKKTKLDFESLYQNSLQLTRGMEELPSLQRSLDQLHAVTSAKSLAGPAPEVASNKAQFLLAGRGFDAEKLSRELRQSELKASFEPRDALAGVSDLDGFLRHHHDMIVVSAIEETMAATTRTAQQNALNTLHEEFQSSKTKLMAFLQGRHAPMSYPRASPSAPVPPSVVGLTATPMPAPQHNVPSTMTEAMKVYAQVTQKLVPRAAATSGDIFLAFETSAKGLVQQARASTLEQETLCCWELLRHMVSFDRAAPGMLELQSAFASQDAALLQSLAGGARTHFELRYRLYIESRIRQEKAPRGGVPGVRALVQTFTRQVLHQANLWSDVYYCLRTGIVADAKALIDDALRSGPATTQLLKHVQAALQSVLQKTAVPPASQVALRDEADHLSTLLLAKDPAVDKFQHAVLNLLSFHDPFARQAGVMENIEDFLWQLQWFAAAQGSARELAAKVVTLVSPSDFNHTTITGVFEYVRLLLVCLQFDTAVESLAAKGYLVEAVHLALALHHVGLFGNHNLFSRLLRQYVHSFQRSNPQEAAMYVTCHQAKDDRRLLSAALLLDTLAFDVLGGTTHPSDASRTPGALDQFLDRAEVREIVLFTSHQATEAGRPADALKLLTLAGDVQSTMVLLNAQLAATLGTADRGLWLEHARSFADTWLRSAWALEIVLNQARVAAHAFQTLMNIGIFLELLDAKKYSDGLAFVEALAILPAPGSEQAAADRFVDLDSQVQRNVHLVLLGYMECLVEEMKRWKQSISDLETQKQMCKQLRDKAKAVVSFTGMITVRLPIGTNERLNQLEIRMM
ncbi:nuclear pore complex protein Nup93-like protein [Achlya hypogyna]|uniref:Nuclear pore protein n=1 Tax=Achlya hypogyna TaxID=1202772 RepID=A0A1V9Z8S1_ACHHY|nr:nuclear pore complex protein Nup93-like protein [Achlya hypogyna]